MDKLTIRVNGDGRFAMEINLDQICQKRDVNRNGRWVKDYPLYRNQVKKIFKYIIQYCEMDAVDEAQSFLDHNKADYGKLFRDVRSGEVRVRI